MITNTTTKTARSIVKQILEQNNIAYSKNIYTNKCADASKRNLCFTVATMPYSVLLQIRAALKVTCVRTTAAHTFAVPSTARYLRIIHCSYKAGV